MQGGDDEDTAVAGEHGKLSRHHRDEFVVGRPFNKYSRPTKADLALVDKRGAHAPCDRRVEIGGVRGRVPMIRGGRAKRDGELPPVPQRAQILVPAVHVAARQLAQPFDVKDWKRGECELIPGKTAPNIAVVERDYPNVYKRFTALGPLMNKDRKSVV